MSGATDERQVAAINCTNSRAPPQQRTTIHNRERPAPQSGSSTSEARLPRQGAAAITRRCNNSLDASRSQVQQPPSPPPPPEPPPVSQRATTTAKTLRPISTTKKKTEPTSKAIYSNNTSATAPATKTKPVGSTQLRGARPANEQTAARGAPGTNKATSGGNKQYACCQHRGKPQRNAADVGATATAPLDSRDTDGPAQLLPPPVFCLGAVRRIYTRPRKGGRGRPRPHR